MRQNQQVRLLIKMIKIVGFSFFLTLACYNVFAQQLFSNDSLNWKLSYQKKIQLHFENPNLVSVGQSDFKLGEAEINYHHRVGDFRRSKDPYSRDVMSFKASGISKINRFIVSGDFIFYRMWEDSLANTLQGDDDDITPFYYFVAKPGQFERQLFKGAMQLRHKGVNKYIQPGIQFAYKANWTTRSVDPRPNVASVSIKINPNVSAEVGSSMLSVGFTFGYGDEENSISYKNQMYKYSLLFPDRIHYTNHGYGYISQNDSSMMRKYNQYRGINLSHSLVTTRIGLYSTLDVERSVSLSTFDVRSRKHFYKRNEFSLETLKAKSQLYMRTDNNREHLIDFAMEYQRGLDYNFNLRSANYFASRYSIGLNYFHDLQFWNLGVGGTLTANEKKDAATDHFHSIKQLMFSFNIRRIINIGKNVFEAELNPNYTLKLANILQIPATQVNVFTKSVVYHDFYYFNLEPVGLELNLGYYVPNLIRSRYTKLFFRNQFATVLHNGLIDSVPNNRRKNNLWQMQIGSYISF